MSERNPGEWSADTGACADRHAAPLAAVFCHPLRRNCPSFLPQLHSEPHKQSGRGGGRIGGGVELPGNRPFRVMRREFVPVCAGRESRHPGTPPGAPHSHRQARKVLHECMACSRQDSCSQVNILSESCVRACPQKIPQMRGWFIFLAIISLTRDSSLNNFIMTCRLADTLLKVF